MDKHGNEIATEGCDRCFCGCKYWEKDRCVDCGTYILDVLYAPCEAGTRGCSVKHTTDPNRDCEVF